MSQELVHAGHPSAGKAEAGGHRKMAQDELMGSGVNGAGEGEASPGILLLN